MQKTVVIIALIALTCFLLSPAISYAHEGLWLGLGLGLLTAPLFWGPPYYGVHVYAPHYYYGPPAYYPSPGYYGPRPQYRQVWIPGHWERYDGRTMWVEGHWELYPY